ncbi:MAG TPA: ribosome maturation factor RimP [Thermoanaerobaculia bacterium]|nr:ribosome maturation factor RimP [Thermoanaerobaculia bacterium]
MAALPEMVEQEIEKIVTSENLELVHIDFKTQGGGMLLRVDIDKEGGVNVDDCVLISQQISAWLDVEDPLPGEYELQVSSPGLDRKFYREADYRKFIGRLVRVRTSNMVKGLYVVIGHLREYDGTKIVVNDPQSRKDYEIEMGNIKEARLEVEM